MCDGYETYLLLVQVIMEHIEGFVALLRTPRLIDTHHAIDGPVKVLVATLLVDGAGEHCLDLVGGGASRALVVVRIQGAEDVCVAEEGMLGLLFFEVGDGQIEGEGL